MNPVWVKLADNGRVTLPSALRREAGLRKGEELWIRVEEEGVVVLMTAEAAVRQGQKLARELLGDALPTADEVIIEKRAQAALEERRMRRLLGREARPADEVA